MESSDGTAFFPVAGKCLVLCLLAFACTSREAVTAAEPPAARLPEGSTGLAARYPGDSGIEADPAIIHVEKFDIASVADLSDRWDEVSYAQTMSLTTDVPAGSADTQSLLITHVGGEGTGGQLYHRLLPGYNRVFARFYVKFSQDCAQIHHFGTHLGGFNPPTPWPQGGAGQLPDGSKRFTSGIEPNATEWHWDFYTYWQGMHVHGDGAYWGTPFLTGGDKPPVERERWICVEMMIAANDPPDQTNGEQAFWIDGKLWRRDGQVVSHIGEGFPTGRWTGGWWRPDVSDSTSFEGFKWRSVEDLLVNYVWTYVYITKAPKGHVSRIWFDNIVVAKEYIGPIVPPPH